MEWVIHLLRQHSELAIFLTIAAGFWIGKIKVGQFSLGIVTSVLLVGTVEWKAWKSEGYGIPYGVW